MTDPGMIGKGVGLLENGDTVLGSRDGRRDHRCISDTDAAAASEPELRLRPVGQAEAVELDIGEGLPTERGHDEGMTGERHDRFDAASVNPHESHSAVWLRELTRRSGMEGREQGVVGHHPTVPPGANPPVGHR